MAKFDPSQFNKQLRQENKKMQALRKEQRRHDRSAALRRNFGFKVKAKKQQQRTEKQEEKEAQQELQKRWEEIKGKTSAKAQELKEKTEQKAKEFHKKVKHKRHMRAAKIGAFVLTGGLGTALTGLLFTATMFIFLGGATTTIAGLANPKQRAILKADHALGGPSYVVDIPSYLIGDEPDLQGQSYMANQDLTNNSDSSSENGNMSQNAYMVYLHYKGKLTDSEIAGMLGCWQHESQVNFHRFEADFTAKGKQLGWDGAKKDDFDPSKMYGSGWASFLHASPSGYRNGHGGYTLGLGIGQFTGPRGYNLMHSGNGWDAPNNQLNWMDTKDRFAGWDGTKSWSYWGSGSNDVTAATTNFLAHWEGVPGNALAERLSDARQWLQKIKDGSIKCSLPGGNNNSKSGNDNGNNSSGSGSVHDQFIKAGGTEDMWKYIVMPESSGNPNASNGQYHGLGQTNQSWGHGSVADQTKGMINYAKTRYGSIANAVAYHRSHNSW